MTTSATSRRAFLAGSAVAAGGFAIAGRLVHATAGGVLTGRAAARPGDTMGWYVLDLPRPPGDAA